MPLLLFAQRTAAIPFPQRRLLRFLLLPPEQLELLGRLLADGRFLRSRRLEHGVQELNLIIIEGSELVLEPNRLRHSRISPPPLHRNKHTGAAPLPLQRLPASRLSRAT